MASTKAVIAPYIHAYKNNPFLNWLTTKGITTNGPMPTISIMLIEVACSKLILRLVSGVDIKTIQCVI